MNEDDWNTSAGIGATLDAERGDWTALRARLCDPRVMLTQWERDWLARLGPDKAGRRANAQEPLLYWWFQRVERMSPNDALLRVCKTLNKTTAKGRDAVKRSIRRAGGAAYDPGQVWHQRATWWLEGNCSPSTLPPALLAQFPDFTTHVSGRTE